MSKPAITKRTLRNTLLLVLTASMLYACSNSSSSAIRFFTTLFSRLIPFQGVTVLSEAPIDHGNPLPPANETLNFVDPDDRTEIAGFPRLGVVENGPGVERLVRNNLRVNSNPVDPQSVFYMLHLTDWQIPDEESPMLTPTNDFALDREVFQGSYRPQGPYIPHMGNAIARAANFIGENSRDYDLAIHTGDAIENSQANELDIFLTLLNGGNVDPDSGDKVDLIRGPGNDPNDIFSAVGLMNANGTRTPWLSLIGNHDILAQGNFPEAIMQFFNSPQAIDGLIQTFGAIAVTIPALSTADFRRDALSQEDLYLIPRFLDADDLPNDGLIPGLNEPFSLGSLLSQLELTVVGFLPFFNSGVPQPQAITADAGRAVIDRCDFINEHLNDGGVPTGHGYTAAANGPVNGVNGDQCSGHYAYVPDNNQALRFVVLDTTKQYGGADGAVARPQEPFNLDLLIDGNGDLIIDAVTSGAFSSNPGLLVQPGTALPLFTLPAPQYAEDVADRNNVQRDTIAFLNDQLATATANNQAVIVVSHHASDTLVVNNDLRFQLETVLCVGLQAVNPALDCDPSDGTQALGNFGESVLGAAGAANVRALDLFAQLVGAILSINIPNYAALTQANLDALAGANAAVFAQLQSTFNLLFTIRTLMPDPVEPLDTDAFRNVLLGGPVIAHLAGHSHQNRILAICDNAQELELGFCDTVGGTAGAGYYEIRTASMVDWPLEQRILEIVDNNDGTLSIFATLFGLPKRIGDRLAELGVRLTLADSMTRPNDASDQNRHVNVELIVPAPAGVDAALDGVGTRNTQIESNTTLL